MTVQRFAIKRVTWTIQALEVNHWGERWPSERVRGYNGYILRREGKTILFAGDTARTPLALHSSAPFNVAIMPIGAYQPWIWNHCTPNRLWKWRMQPGLSISSLCITKRSDSATSR